MPLGKLGAFGKTNVLDVSSGLIRQYNEGLVQANQIRKDNLLMALKDREEKRAQDKHDFEMKKLQDLAKPIDLTDYRDKVGPAVFDLGIEDAKASGVVWEDGGRYYTSRDRISENQEGFNRLIDTKGMRYYDAYVKDLRNKLVTAQKTLNEMKPDDEKRPEQEKLVKGISDSISNMMQQEPTIRQHYEKKVAEGKAEDASKKGQSIINENNANAEEARARAKKLQAEAVNEEKTGGKKALVWKAKNSKDTREGVLNYMITNKLIPQEALNVAMGGEGIDDLTLAAGSGKVDMDKLYLEIRANYPEVASYISSMSEKVKVKMLEAGADGLDETEALGLVIEDMREEALKKEGDRLYVQGGAMEAFNQNTAPSSGAAAGSAMSGNVPPPTAPGGMTTAQMKSLGHQMAHQVKFDYTPQDSNGNILFAISGTAPGGKERVGTITITPANDAERKQINEAIQQMLASGWTPGHIEQFIRTEKAFQGKIKYSSRDTGKPYPEVR